MPSLIFSEKKKNIHLSVCKKVTKPVIDFAVKNHTTPYYGTASRVGQCQMLLRILDSIAGSGKGSFSHYFLSFIEQLQILF